MQIFRVEYDDGQGFKLARKDFGSIADAKAFITPVSRRRPDGSIRTVYAGIPGAKIEKIYPSADKDRFRREAIERKYQRMGRNRPRTILPAIWQI